MKTRDIIFEMIVEADESPKLENELKELIQKDLAVNIEIDSYSEDKENGTLSMYFYLPMESNNLYFQMEYADNGLDLFMLVDPRSKGEQESMQDTTNAIYSRPLPILSNDNIPELLLNMKRTMTTTIENKIREYLS